MNDEDINTETAEVTPETDNEEETTDSEDSDVTSEPSAEVISETDNEEETTDSEDSDVKSEPSAEVTSETDNEEEETTDSEESDVTSEASAAVTTIGSEPGPIPTAVVGYGFAGRDFHSYLVSLEPGLKLTAVATRDEGRRTAAAETYPQIQTYETLDELLAKDSARLIVLATPHDTHEELAVKALNAGRHVVVDKAMCLTVAEADRMIQASEANNVMLSVFHNRRWDGDYLTLRNVIDSGTLGEVFLIEECVMGYGQPGRWRGVKSEGGGPLYDWGAHLVDHGVQIGGKPKWVFCETQRHKWTTDVETYVRCLMKFESGLTYSVEVGYLAKYSKPKFFALGTEGGFRKEGVDPQEGFMIQKRIRDSAEDPANRAFVKTTINGLQTEIRPDTIKGDWCQYYKNIAEHLSTGVKLEVEPHGVRTAVQVIESAMESAATGQVVHLQA